MYAKQGGPTNTCLQETHHSSAIIGKVSDAGDQAGRVKPGAAIAGQASNDEDEPERRGNQSAQASCLAILIHGLKNAELVAW